MLRCALEPPEQVGLMPPITQFGALLLIQSMALGPLRHLRASLWVFREKMQSLEDVGHLKTVYSIQISRDLVCRFPLRVNMAPTTGPSLITPHLSLLEYSFAVKMPLVSLLFLPFLH